MGILGWPWKKSRVTTKPANGMAVVPEGFVLRTWPGEIPTPSFTRMDGGVLLASSGPATDANLEVLRSLFDGVETALSRPHEPARLPARPGTVSDLFEAAAPEVVLVDNVVAWTLQEGILEGWADNPLRLQEMLQRVHGFASSRRGSRQFLQRILVRISYFNEMSRIFQLIKGLGIEVWEMVPDGTALLEVHRPDGTIISVMVGKEIESVAGSEPQRLARERDLAALRGDRTALERIDGEERQLIESAIQRQPERARPFEQAPLLRSLLLNAAGGDAQAREKILRYLLERSTPLVIPMRAASRRYVEGTFDFVGDEKVFRAFPDLQSARQLAPPDRSDAVLPMRPAPLLDLCRQAQVPLVLEAPGKDGPVIVIVRAEEVDALAPGS